MEDPDLRVDTAVEKAKTLDGLVDESHDMDCQLYDTEDSATPNN